VDEKKQGTESTPVEGAGVSQSAAASTGTPPQGPLAQGQRWSVARKREVVMRMLRGGDVILTSRTPLTSSPDPSCW